MKKAILALLIFGMQGLLAQTYNVDDAIKYAIENNYDVQSQVLSRAITYQQTNEVMSQGFPKVSVGVGYQNNFKLMTSMLPGEIVGQAPGTLVPVQFGTRNNISAMGTLQQLIVDGRYIVGLKARKTLKEFATSQLTMSVRDVKELIMKNYYQVLMLENTIKAMEDNKEVLSTLIKQMQTAYEVGVIEELDVDRLNLNLTTLQNAVISLRSQKEIAELSLKFNMGYNLDSPIYLINDIVDRVDLVMNTEYFLSDDFEKRIELDIINKSVELSKYDWKQTKAMFYPSLYGNVNFGYQAFRNDFRFTQSGTWFPNGNFGIQLSIPIFNGLTTYYKVQQAKLKYHQSQVNQTKTYNAMKLQLSNSLVALKNSIINYKNQVDLHNLNKRIENTTQIKYKEGVGSSFEFVQAQYNSINQEVQLNQAMLELINSYVNFQISTGQIQ